MSYWKRGQEVEIIDKTAVCCEGAMIIKTPPHLVGKKGIVLLSTDLTIPITTLRIRINDQIINIDSALVRLLHN